MQPDLYTKAVLTVIAACLIILASKELQLIPKAYAATDRSDEVVKVQIVGIRASPFHFWEALPVKIEK